MSRGTEPSSRRRTTAACLLLVAPLLAAAAVAGQQTEPVEPPPPVPPVAAVEAPAPPPPVAAVEAPPAPPPVVAVEAPAPPPPPPAPDRPRRQRRTDAQVVVGSSLTIDEDEITDDVVVVGGSLVVRGEVLGDAVVIGGSLRIDGKVMGDAAAVGGSLSLGPEAEVMGDAMSFGGGVHREDGAQILGEVIDVSSPQLHLGMWPPGDWGDWGMDGFWGKGWWEFSPLGWLVGQAWRIFSLALLVLFAFLALLLARRPIDRMAQRVAVEPWKCGLVGLAAQILFIPLLVMVVVILCISIIGIPFLFLLPFALVALAVVIFFGYVAVAMRLGELLRARFDWRLTSPFAVLALGIAGLKVWSVVGHMLDFDGPPMRLFAGIFLLFGFLVGYVAWTLATGSALLTRFATASGWSRGRSLPAPPPPAAPAEWQEPAAAPADDRPWEPELDAGEEQDR